MTLSCLKDSALKKILPQPETGGGDTPHLHEGTCSVACICPCFSAVSLPGLHPTAGGSSGSHCGSMSLLCMLALISKHQNILLLNPISYIQCHAFVLSSTLVVLKRLQTEIHYFVRNDLAIVGALCQSPGHSCV